MKVLQRIGFCAALALGSVLVWGDTTNMSVLTWPECVRIAREKNPSLQAARAQWQAAASALAATRTELRPQLSVNASAEHSEPRADRSDDVDLNAGVSAEQILFTGGKKQAAVRIAEANLSSAQAAYRAVLAEVTRDLRIAFVKRLIAQQRVAILEAIRQRRAENLELVRLRYEGGREHKGSLALTEAAYFQAESELAQARRTSEMALSDLARIMAWEDMPTNLEVTGSLDVSPPPQQPDFAACVEVHPSVAKAMATLNSARANLQSAKAAYFPNLSLVGSAGRSGTMDEFESDRWSAGVRMTYPLWPGGKTQHDLQQAKARYGEAEASLLEVKLAAERRLQEAWVNWQNAIDNVRVRQRYFEAADLRAEIARQQYGAGLLSFENWDLIENDRISHQRQWLEAQQTALIAEAEWKFALGENAFEDETEETL